jgi:hypothetical protein
MSPNTRLRAAAKAFLLHLVLSAFVAGITGMVIFSLWFPFPFRELAGGEYLFWTLVGVDMVCGPILTAILFDPQKSRLALRIDMTLIATLQLGALAYGIDSISKARPAVLAFEVDRFVGVAAGHIDQQILATTPYSLSWAGPVLLGTREPKNSKEVLKSIEQSIQGIEPSARPDWWQAYETSKPEIKMRMRPLSTLRSKRPTGEQEIIDAAVKKTTRKIKDISYLPLVTQKTLEGWVVLLDSNANIIGYAPVNGF